MLLQPPNTEFYQNPLADNLWRDLARLYSQHAGSYGQYKMSFIRVLSDLMWRLEPMPCAQCSTNVENVATDSCTRLKCPKCGWEPVKVRQVEVAS